MPYDRDPDPDDLVGVLITATILCALAMALAAYLYRLPRIQ